MIRNIQRIAVLAAMIAVLWFLYSGSNQDYGWAVWSILALALCMEHISFHIGMTHGMNVYRTLGAEHRKEIDNILEDIDKND